jgi:hypothetical protein
MEREENGKSNIKVAIRVRPLLEKEVQNAEFEIARVEDNLVVSLPGHLRSYRHRVRQTKQTDDRTLPSVR